MVQEYMSHFSAVSEEFLDAAAVTDYAVTGPELIHTNDSAAEVYLWVCRLSKSPRYHRKLSCYKKK